METKEINLIFQFLEEIYENDKSNSSIKKKKKKLFGKLETLKAWIIILIAPPDKKKTQK